MQTGDQVRVYPAGNPAKAATGTIVLVSGNGRSIAVGFGEEYVPFMTGAIGMAIHPEHGKMLLALLKEECWCDLFTGTHYVIEGAYEN